MSEKEKKTKSIKINPAIFNIGKGTKKAKREKPAKPLIPQRSLKHKLLNRIKDHKKNEIKEKNDITKDNKDNDKNKSKENEEEDDFLGSLNYLKELSKRKIQEKTDEKKREHLQKKTVRNFNFTDDKVVPHVELELPEELKLVPFTPPPPLAIQSTLNYEVDKTTPYGCLKGGNKPTYKEWKNKTQKNNDIVSLSEGGGGGEKSDREIHMQRLKQKIQERNQDEPSFSPPPTPAFSSPAFSISTPILNPIPNPRTIVSFNEKNENNDEDNKEKRIIKKTTRKTYKLGKSQKHNHVGILIKNNDTRKQVTSAQKELKKKPINDVKTYLREHGLLKAGSNAPNDVIRKMYESSMLSGELMNNNKETLLHNFMNDT